MEGLDSEEWGYFSPFFPPYSFDKWIVEGPPLIGPVFLLQKWRVLDFPVLVKREKKKPGRKTQGAF